MRKFIVLASFAALAACGSSQEGTFETEDGEEVSYSVDQDDEGTTTTVATSEGEVRMQSGANVKVQLPDGFSLLDGAEVVTNSHVKSNEGENTSVFMRVPVSPDKAIAAYKAQAEAAGVTIEQEVTMNEMVMIGGTSKDGLQIAVQASPAEEGGAAVNLTTMSLK